MEIERRSIDDAKAWLKAQKERGDMNGTTGRLRITAIDQLAAFIAEGEQKTAQWMLDNIELLGRRWINKSNGTPDTAQTYISRAKAALADFLRFQADPLNYKPTRNGDRPPKRSASPSPKETTGDETATRSAQDFKLPKSSYDELCKVIKAYAHAGPEASIDDITSLSGVADSRVSKNSGFLISVGLITEGKTKSATALGRRLGNALEHDQPTEIAAAWREVVQQSEFLRRMVAAVRIRKGMDINDLQGHIAYSAGVPKNSDTMAGARTLANVLVISGLVLEQDGKLSAVAPLFNGTTATAASSGDGAPPTPFAALDLPVSTPSGVAVQLRINLNISATPPELTGLGEILRKVIDDLRQVPAQSSVELPSEPASPEHEVTDEDEATGPNEPSVDLSE